MPYIKKKLRPPFDRIIERAKHGDFTIFDCVADACEEVKKFTEDKYDGCLNYFFTQLFRQLDDVEMAEIISSLTLMTVYLCGDRISYFRIERAVGLLENMIDEFVRRKWTTEDSEIMKALKQMLFQTKYIRDKYEDEKITENGDLD